MKALVAGLNGTVAPVLVRALFSAGHTVIPWDRSAVPIDDHNAARDFIQREDPIGSSTLLWEVLLGQNW